MIVGHPYIVAQLERGLPRVSLFHGPKSVGKWTTAEHFRRKLGYSPSDVFVAYKLSIETARELKLFAASAPVGEGKLAILGLTGSSEASQHAILKVLEESPADTKFILVAETLPLKPIVSRAQMFNFNRLSVDEIAEILQKKKGFRSDGAKRAASSASGTVASALRTEEVLDTKSKVLELMEAMKEKDLAKVEHLGSTWDQNAQAMLLTACRQVVTKKGGVFTDKELEDYDTSLALRVLRSSGSNIRPRLMVRALLLNEIKGK